MQVCCHVTLLFVLDFVWTLCPRMMDIIFRAMYARRSVRTQQVSHIHVAPHHLKHSKNKKPWYNYHFILYNISASNWDGYKSQPACHRFAVASRLGLVAVVTIGGCIVCSTDRSSLKFVYPKEVWLWRCATPSSTVCSLLRPCTMCT